MALTKAQNALVDRVEYYADQVTAAAQSVGLNRDAAYTQLEETALSLLQQAPREMLSEVSKDGSGSPTDQGGAIDLSYIALPDDYLRFLEVHLEGWDRHLYRLIDPRANAWRLVYNDHTGPDPRNPAAIETPLNYLVTSLSTSGATTTTNILVCAPKVSGTTITTFEYIPETAPENMPPDLEDILVWKATSRVLEAQKEAGAQAAEERALRLMQDRQFGYAPPGTLIGNPQTDDR